MLRAFSTFIFGTKQHDDDTGPDIVRRRFLAGLSAVGGLVAVGSILVPASDAKARVPLDPTPAAKNGDVVLVQRRRRDDDDDSDFEGGSDDDDSDGVSGRSFRRDRRDRDRRDRRDRRRGDRMSRREIRFRCRNDRRFRRNNRRLCDIASGGGRRGSCVQIGPVLLCD